MEQISKENKTYNEKVIWWEKKRPLFNLLVGLTGLITLIYYGIELNLFDLIGILLWGIVANVLYSVGLLLEILSDYYLKQKNFLSGLRWPLFIIGTAAYCTLSYYFGMIYCLIK